MSGFKVERAATSKVQVTTSDLNADTLNSKISVTGGLTKTVLNPGANEVIQLSASTAVSQVAVTNSDTTPSTLSSKVAAGTGISLAVVNPGGDEDLQITNSHSGMAKITASDTTPAVLNSKITVGTGLSKATVNGGGNETLNLVNTTSGQVQVTASDTTPAVLNSKITAGDWLTKSTENGGSNEALKLNFAPSAAVAISALDIDWVNPNHTFYKTLGANSTFTFSNTVEGKTIIVALTNTASNYTVTWPVSVKWRLGSAPIQSTGAVTDIYTFVRINGVIYGSAIQNFP